MTTRRPVELLEQPASDQNLANAVLSFPGFRCFAPIAGVMRAGSLLTHVLLGALLMGCSPAAPKPAASESATQEEPVANPVDSAPVAAPPRADQPAPSLPFSLAEATNWSVRFADMQAVLNLNEEQQARLKQAFANHAETLQDWYAEHGDQLVELETRFMNALQQRDLGAMRDLGAKAKGLKDMAAQLYRDYQREILEALPEDKRREWQVHVVSKRFGEIAAALQLTQEQQDSVSRLVRIAVERAPDSVHWEGEALGNLKQLFEREVLRQDQRQLWQEINKADPLQWLKTLSGQ